LANGRGDRNLPHGSRDWIGETGVTGYWLGVSGGWGFGWCEGGFGAGAGVGVVGVG